MPRSIQLPSQPACWSWPIPTLRDVADATVVQIVEFQAGRCGMCARQMARLLVDHDHWSNLVRGFLCHSCNPSEGGDHAAFDAYRRRHPAAMLGCRIEYTAWSRKQLQGYRTGRELGHLGTSLIEAITGHGAQFATRNPDRLAVAVERLTSGVQATRSNGRHAQFQVCAAAFRIADLIESTNPCRTTPANAQVLQLAEQLVSVGTACMMFSTALLRTRRNGASA